MKQIRVRSSLLRKNISMALSAGLLATTLSLTAPAWAQSAGTVRFDIPAQPLSTALQAYAAQADMQLLYRPESVSNVATHAVQGELDKREALRRLLDGTGLEVVYSSENAATIRPVPPSAAVQKKSDPASAATTGLDGAEKGDAVTVPVTGKASVATLDTLVVTGTRIRGGTAPSPVIAIGSEQMREEGFADLGEVIRSVPQNFSGGQNPGVIPFTISGAGTQNTNLSGGSALNLRGLGPDATLTLLNGRRMAYDGISQGVDISAIPVAAVERIEIVADGASAIYGSDAVGGVGNVILKRDYEGGSVGAGYGTATDGGLATREYTATAGHRWSSGGIIATYKDVSADPIYARQRAYTSFLRDPYTIYPGTDLRSGLLSFHQSLGASAELRLDAFRTERSQAYGAYDNQSRVFVSAAPDVATTLISPGIEFYLPNDWTLSLGATRSKDSLHHFQTIALADTGAVLLETRLCFCNRGRSYEVGAEGPLFELPAGDARLALGAGRRENNYLERNEATGATTTRGDEGARFAYAELHLPLLGEGLSDGGGQRLELTAAARQEAYDSFGSVLTPKLGMIYNPGTDVTFKASWGRSFKAPTLYQLYRQRVTGYSYAASYGGAGYPAGAAVLLVDGGNPDLGPERARTSNVSMAFHPAAVPALEAELAWFDIRYGDRVVAPITNSAQALSNPAFADFVVYAPTAQEQAAAIARSASFLNYIGMPYDPTNVVAIVNMYYTNVTRQRIHGLDLSGSYGFDLGNGKLTVRGSSSWLRSSQQGATGTFDLAGTIYNPPRLVGRLGAVWNRGGFTASAFANYKAGVENAGAGQKTASFTTFDMVARYAPDGRDSPLRHWEFALSLDNVFDRPPPLNDTTTLTSYLIPPYDATNYSAIGRFVRLSVARRW